MQAVYLKDQSLSLISDYPKPIPQRNEALIRVTLAGICSTDLELMKGYYPYDGVLGHEFVGVVESVGENADATLIGKRVVGTINISPECNGTCGMRCPEQCPHRVVLGIVNKDGIFADHVTLPTVNLLQVPDGVSDEQAVFTEPLAAALRVTEQVDVVGKQAAVIGPGRLGTLVAQVLRHAGAEVVVIGRSEKSLELPKDLGFKTYYNDSLKLSDFDLVVETTANPQGFAQAVDLVRPNGHIVLKSTYAEGEQFENMATLMSSVVVKEITLVGSRCGPFAPALQLLEEEAIQTECLISAEFPLSDAMTAFEKAAQPGVKKVLLRM